MSKIKYNSPKNHPDKEKMNLKSVCLIVKLYT